MTDKERLQEIVARLPERDIATAIALLERLETNADDALRRVLDAAPVDDEPDDDDFDGGLTEARGETALSHEEVRRLFAR